MKPWFFLLSLSLGYSGLSQAQSNGTHFRQGKDYAIFFAVNDYKSNTTVPSGFYDLQNPIKDAESIALELEKRFGFATEVIKNPDYDQVEAILKKYKRNFAENTGGKFPADGQLFIFFSGHGVFDHEEGYFAPAGAVKERIQRTCLLYSFLRTLVDGINCNHILVAIDACHSRSFDERYRMRTDLEFKRPGELSIEDRVLENHKLYKSRVFFTSDAVGEMTPDKSDFAKQFLTGLRTFNTQTSYMTSSQLFANHIKNASPPPHGGEFGSDEPASTFLFFFPSVPNLPGSSSNDVEDWNWNWAKSQNTILAYQIYLQQFPQGKFRQLAQDIIKQLEGQLPSTSCPPLTIQTFQASSGVSRKPSATVTVPPGFKIIGGGAVVNFSTGPGKPGCLLFESYPSSPTTWTASAKDHLEPFNTSLSAYAIALYDPNDEWEVQIKSSSSNHATIGRSFATSQLDEGYVLTGGGAQSIYSGPGHVLFASYPENNSWNAGSKDHGDPSNGFVVSYAIGIKPRVNCSQRLKSDRKSLYSNNPINLPEGTTPEQQNGWLLTGGGAKLNNSGVGQLLTASYPLQNRWFARGKDHKFPTSGTIDVYGIYVRFE